MRERVWYLQKKESQKVVKDPFLFEIQYSQENRILYWIQSGHLDPQRTHLQKRIFCIFLLWSGIQGLVLYCQDVQIRLGSIPSSSVSSMQVVRTADKWLFIISNKTLSATSEPVWIPRTFANCSKGFLNMQSRILGIRIWRLHVSEVQGGCRLRVDTILRRSFWAYLVNLTVIFSILRWTSFEFEVFSLNVNVLRVPWRPIRILI